MKIQHPMVAGKLLPCYGQSVFDLTGNIDAMREVADEVANEGPGSWGGRINIIDKGWNGVGGRWWC